MKSSRVQERSNVEVVQQDIVRYAASNWFRDFSRIFDGFVSSGPKLPKVAVKIAFNSKRFQVLSSETPDSPPLLSMGYSQIKKATSLRSVECLVDSNTEGISLLHTLRFSTYYVQKSYALT